MDIKKIQLTQKKATDLMKSGESSLNTHLFKWKPNYLEASPKFMEASSMFENIGQYDPAIKCYEKLALCYEKLDDLYGAADAYQKIGFIFLNQKKDPKTAYSYLMKSVNLFKIHGNLLKAQDMMKKVGKKCFEQNHEDLGVQIYSALMEEVFDEQYYGTGSEVITEYLNFLIDKERNSVAIDLYMKHIKYLQSVRKYEHLVCRAWLGIICLHIIMGEHYIAEEKLSTFGSQISKPMSSDEYLAAMGLLDNITKGDEANYSKILKRPIFTQIEPALLRKLKKFKMPGKEEIKKMANPLFGSGVAKPKPKEEEKVAVPPKENNGVEDVKEKIQNMTIDSASVPPVVEQKSEGKENSGDIPKEPATEIKKITEEKKEEPAPKPTESAGDENKYGGMFA